METFLARWSPDEFLALVGIVLGTVTAVVLILAFTKYHLQALTADTELKRERQRVELSLKEKLVERASTLPEAERSLESLLGDGTSPPHGAALLTEDALDVELAKRIGSLDASPNDIERTLVLVLAADTRRRRSALGTMEDLEAKGADPTAIQAALRSLCATPARAQTPTGV
jgi:hypothetical protein